MVGGLYERLVGMVKRCLQKATGQKHFTLVLGDALPVLFSALGFCLFSLLLFAVCRLADFVLALYLLLLVGF